MDVAKIFEPVFVMVALTFAVSCRMYWLRLAEIRRGRIDPQAVSTSAEMSRLVKDTRAADNFRNLFELPVLFYAAAFVAVLGDAITPFSIACAWLFVATRIVHSLIHCTYNRVMHRFTAYIAGSLVLLAWWVHLAMHVLG